MTLGREEREDEVAQDPKSTKAAGLFQKGLKHLFPERHAEAQAHAATGAVSSSAAARTGPSSSAPLGSTAPGAMPPGVTPHGMASLAAVARYRIVLLDNAGRPLYPLPGRGTASLSPSEEEIARARALAALHEARAAGRILGKPAAGAYAGREAEAIMGEASAADLQAFLAFVLANPRGFLDRPLRISEAFLAWLVDYGKP